MEFEVTQNQLDAVVVRQAADIDALRIALESAIARLDAASKTSDGGDAGEAPPPDHELPPHY